MRLHVHDFSGHPVHAELSRALAARGHHVHHSYCDRYGSGKAALTPSVDDPASFTIAPVGGRAAFDADDPVRRIRFELTYARDLGRAITAGSPDAVVLCNAPLVTTYLLGRALGRRGVPWAFWHQDVHSVGIADEAARRLPAAPAALVSGVFRRMERACVRDADAVVAVDGLLIDRYRDWHLDTAHVAVIPNRAPVAAIVPTGRDNGWSREHRLPDRPLRLLYSGTLGRRRNPILLLELLRRTRVAGLDVHLTVMSDGDGADLVRAVAGPEDEVLVLPFEDAERSSEVLSSADVLVALLEPSASRFSIPGEVQSYLAAGRPIIGLVPRDSAASRAIRAVGGATAEPELAGTDALVPWLAELAAHPAEALRLGRAARCHAERESAIDAVADRFDTVLRAVGGRDARLLAPTP